MDGAVCQGGKAFVMCDYYECLIEAVAQVEEETVKLSLVCAVEAAGRLICKHYRWAVG